jgi:hypothetical protein
MGAEVLIMGILIIVGYKLISRQIEVKQLEAEARLREGGGSDMDEVREELAQIREMLADVLLEDHARGGSRLKDGRGTDALNGR